MSRSAADKRRIANACHLYPETGSEKIVLRLLRMIPEIDSWLDRSSDPLGRLHRHHIYGRSTKEQANWFCNIIGLNELVHRACHDRFPRQVELCCLRAQWELQIKHNELCKFEGRVSQPGHEKYWNVPALSTICGSVSLAGRIEVALLPSVKNTKLKAIAEELIVEAENDDLPF